MSSVGAEADAGSMATRKAEADCALIAAVLVGAVDRVDKILSTGDCSQAAKDECMEAVFRCKDNGVLVPIIRLLLAAGAHVDGKVGRRNNW